MLATLRPQVKNRPPRSDDPDVDLATTRADTLCFARFATDLIAQDDHAVT